MIPDELRAWPQWVTWRSETCNGKPTKVPYRADVPQLIAEIDKPRTWGTYEDAAAIVGVDGVGFVFSAEDPNTGVDLDDCVDPETGWIHPAAPGHRRPPGQLHGALTLGARRAHHRQGALRGDRHSTGDTPWGGKFEVYDRGRFFTVTGRASGPPRRINGPGERGIDGPGELDAIVAERLPRQTRAAACGNGRPGVPLSDSQLREKMFAARNGGKIRDLYYSSGGEDPSAADLALCGHLAFFTGGDPDQMDVMFRASGRMRSKWDKRHRGDGATYGQMTIEKAIAGQSEFYDWTRTTDGNSARANAADPERDEQNTEPAASRDAPDVSPLEDISLADALARELPPEQWIVENLIAPATIGFLHGLPETMKTFLALHIGIGVARATEHGEPQLLLGKLRVTDPGPVGYIW